MQIPRPLPSQRPVYLIRVCESGTRWTSAANRFWLPPPVTRREENHTSDSASGPSAQPLRIELISLRSAQQWSSAGRNQPGVIVWAMDRRSRAEGIGWGHVAQEISATARAAGQRVLQLITVDDYRNPAILELTGLGAIAAIRKPEDMPLFRRLLDRHRQRLTTAAD